MNAFLIFKSFISALFVMIGQSPARFPYQAKPIHWPASFILARLVKSAQARDDDSEPVILVGQNVEGSILLLIFAMRRLHRDSWKQAARLFGFENALDADGHGRRTMRNLVFLRASDYLRKRMLEDAEELISHFHFAPKKTLQTLHPFEIGDNYAAGIAKNVRDHKDLVPALLEN